MMKYLIVIEETKTGYSAYSPDVPGCVATGATREEVEQAIRDALQLHLEGLKMEGYDSPAPRSYSKYVEPGITSG
jgi:predicted RNase H-like HicB family nuclease